ncbi:MAG: GSCFA domain-containing protein [Chitinophagaceae bacterium]|nr:GSCFA domain-containing protein [Chitinophagaceae bacterium]
MEFFLPLTIKKPAHTIHYKDKILLIGSCFTEHIGQALETFKFQVLSNPGGILFAPDAVCRHLSYYRENKIFSEEDVFYLNDVWNSWQHHSRFSHTDKTKCLSQINQAHLQAHVFLKEVDFIIITLGSSYTYFLTPEAPGFRDGCEISVANCHRAPSSWFRKTLLDIEFIKHLLQETVRQITEIRPSVFFIFTISPVRHIRDGAVENNRSKARLIEAMHDVCERFSNTYYFPAFELVIDILRDYRFYDADLVHPNYLATEFVLKHFRETCLVEEARKMMTEIEDLITARRHKPSFPETPSHRAFKEKYYQKALQLQQKYPYLNFQEELVYFSNDYA